MPVFQPTLVSELIANNVRVEPGATVLDLGCGTGFIGLEMAKRGAIVTCSDIMPEACAVARGRGLNAIQSDLFQNIQGKFDCIIDDVSGICDQVARLSPWYPEPIPTGGFDGSETPCRMIEQAPAFLNKGGVLYLPISTLSNYKKTLREADRRFQLKNIRSKWIPFCKELESGFEQLKSAPIEVIKRGSRHLWEFRLYELRLV